MHYIFLKYFRLKYIILRILNIIYFKIMKLTMALGLNFS